MARVRNSGTADERFDARVKRGSGCWEWHGFRDKGGHGKFGVSNGLSVLAHRYAYELWVGPIPDGMFVHHRCDNPPCVNPDHLELKTPGQHSRDHMFLAGVRNQYGDAWPVAATDEERRRRNREWMRAKRARLGGEKQS